MEDGDKIKMGECVSPLTVDRCPHCTDTCNADIYKERYSDLLDETINPSWCGSRVECGVCTHTWVAVYSKNSKKLECPSCGEMNHFIINN